VTQTDSLHETRRALLKKMRAVQKLETQVDAASRAS
jgi:hypothetical protein